MSTEKVSLEEMHDAAKGIVQVNCDGNRSRIEYAVCVKRKDEATKERVAEMVGGGNLEHPHWQN